MKRVLVVTYSQTGQLNAAVQSTIQPLLEADDVELHVEYIKPRKAYPFPWPFFEFFDAFPESVYMEPPEMAPFSLKGDEPFDLVILAYQVWFLSPAQPIVGFLKSDVGRALLAGRPVVTLIACRNMWLNAHRKMGTLLKEIGARHCDNIVLTDAGSSLATFITTPRWLLTGKREAFWGFPAAGVSQQDIKNCKRFGVVLQQALSQNLETEGESMLQGMGAVTVNTALIASEMAAHRSFLIWGKLLRAVGRPGQLRRRPVLLLYILFLVTLILTVVPISMLLKKLLQPLLADKLNQQKRLHEEPSGSDWSRMEEFCNGDLPK